MTTPEKRLVIGTAGHIDHGKTALVKALTGVDTDRLKEEKRRGITIELGFTSLLLPSGARCGVVDVPGHERFVDHMVAGATGIDLVLLVVAADEGVMPQTVEHLTICRLLGIKAGLVAMTKVDLVDEDMRLLAAEDISGLVRGTFLEGKPIVSFSAVTGEGKEALLRELDRVAREVTEKTWEGAVRMPIDRVFTMKGFGTVVTGTLLAGKMRVGDTVDILPSARRVKVRGLQVHNASVDQAHAGSRTAVNLQGVEKSAIQRGEILASPDRFLPSRRLYLDFQYHPQADHLLPDRFRFMVHWGTAKVLGRIRLLSGADSLKPGSSELVQIVTESPLFPVFGDRLIARDFSTNRTLGGGVILDPHAAKFRERDREQTLTWLRKLREGHPEDRISYYLWKQRFLGGSLAQMALWTRLSMAETESACRALKTRGEIQELDSERGNYLRTDFFEALKDEILAAIRLFHQQNPYQSGMPKESLMTAFETPVPEKTLLFVLSQLSLQGRTEQERDRVSLAEHRVRLSGQDESLRLRIREILREKGTMPPVLKELAEQLGKPEPELRTLVEYMTQQGEAVKVGESLYFLASTLEELKDRLVSFLRERGEILPGDFKDLSQTTRKYSIPLMEYFDRIRLTLRVGDRRVLREK